MQKRLNSEVKLFSFNALDADPAAADNWQKFELPELDAAAVNRNQLSAKIIRAEREAEAKTQFRVDEIVRECRGLSSQERGDLESRINAEVEKKLRETREAAYREGIEKGRQEGIGNAFQEAKSSHESQIEQVAQMVEGLQEQCAARFEAEKSSMYEMLKRLLKWLVLKEVKDDSYLPKLLEKLVLEMNQRQNLLIRVNPEDFANMPAVLEGLEKRLGVLSNVRVEPSSDIGARGIILESENGIIDGTPEAMFQTLDKLFEAVVDHES
jgi:flagellar assembly protein FliH